MQRFAAISLSTFYLVLSMGFMVNQHYCGGKLNSVNIGWQVEPCCCGDKIPMKDCCSDESVLLQIEDDHQASGQFKVTTQSLALIAILIPTNEQINNEAIFPVCFSSPDPPPIPGRSKRIKYGSLLTFG